MTPGFDSRAYIENWKIWIDFNQDGDFDDAGEEIFSGSSDAAISSVINIPTGISLGQTQMRVSMQWGGIPEPCSTFTYGEVEDYTVDIMQTGLVAYVLTKLSTAIILIVVGVFGTMVVLIVAVVLTMQFMLTVALVACVYETIPVLQQ